MIDRRNKTKTKIYTTFYGNRWLSAEIQFMLRCSNTILYSKASTVFIPFPCVHTWILLNCVDVFRLSVVYPFFRRIRHRTHFDHVLKAMLLYVDCLILLRPLIHFYILFSLCFIVYIFFENEWIKTRQRKQKKNKKKKEMMRNVN